jgi:N-formylmaleamate deformylase
MLPHWTETDIAGIHVYRTGTRTGKPALVLVHGFSDNGLCWAPVARELEDEYEILMPEARAHGCSARVERGQRIDQVEDLAATLRALEVGPAIVAGHSMGAGMAAHLAARCPELVRALLLEDPPWWPIETMQARPASLFDENSPVALWLRGLQAQPLAAAMAQCKAEHPTWPEMYLRPWVEGKQQLDLTFLATENNSMGFWPEIVPAIHCPTLLVTADPAQGGIVTPELAEEICSCSPHFRLAHFPGTGHHVRFAVHADYLQVVRGFLAEVDKVTEKATAKDAKNAKV